MSNTRVKCHPTLRILIGADGHVMVPAVHNRKAHWTFGYKNSDGYMRVKIAQKLYAVHRLVLEAFVGPCPKGFECNHKNRNRSDNRLENLEWVTSSENSRNTSSHDRVTAQGRTHLYEDKQQYKREWRASYNQAKRKTHRRVQFSDGIERWLPIAEAEALFAIPVKQRIFKG